MVEVTSKRKVGQRGWNRIQFLVELSTKSEVRERKRKIVNFFVKFMPKRKMGEGLWERVDFLVEPFAKREVGER